MSLSIGPLVLPSGVVAAMCIYGLALLAGWLVVRRQPQKASVADALFYAALVGLVVARIAFVVQYLDQYQGHWFAVLDIRDLGFNGWAGGVAAVVMAILLAWRRAALRYPLLAAGMTAAVATVMAVGVLQLFQPSNMTVPSVQVTQITTLQTAPLNTMAQNKPRVINLWASWCPPCRHEMPFLQAARKRHPQIAFLLVNQGESVDTVRQFLSSQGLEAQGILLDPYSALSNAIGSQGLPTTLFFHADGTLSNFHFGALSRATLHQYLLPLLEETKESETVAAK